MHFVKLRDLGGWGVSVSILLPVILQLSHIAIDYSYSMQARSLKKTMRSWVECFALGQ